MLYLVKKWLFIFTAVFPCFAYGQSPHQDSELQRLAKKQNQLYHSSSAPHRVKGQLFHYALENYVKGGKKKTYRSHRLSNEHSFILTHKHKPQYFQESFSASIDSQYYGSTADFYDYLGRQDPESSEYWVDFANRHLCGGAFGKGFVQEEIMCVEMPEIADYALSKTLPNGRTAIFTRTYRNQSDRVKEGSPKPLVLKGVQRVQRIDGVYGREINNYNRHNIVKRVTAINPPIRVNVLAIAAPKLGDRKDGTRVDTVEDLFNTIVAGFELAKQATKPWKRTHIHSGPLGAGAFKNDRRVVYVLHRLAALYADVDLTLHGYGARISQEGEADLEAVLEVFSDTAQRSGDDSIEQLLQTTAKVMKQRI